ncbi:MAG TPA: hypothetical protein VI727_11715, partial [Candidatus Brocadiaceae bacterium]|nr:hypothetical protein [Candidatus Brocadiaceae bacterium]
MSSAGGYPVPPAPSRWICGAAFGRRAERGGGQRQPEGFSRLLLFFSVSSVRSVVFIFSAHKKSGFHDALEVAW